MPQQLTHEQIEERAIKKRESQRRWRAKNREKVREAQRRWYAENRDKYLQQNREWKARNQDKVRAARERYKERHPEWRAQLAAAQRRYLERKRAIKKHWPEFGELREAALMQVDIYATVFKAVPSQLPAWLRDDVISEVVLAILEGRASTSDVVAAIKLALRDLEASSWKEVSLDAPMYANGPTYLERLTYETA